MKPTTFIIAEEVATWWPVRLDGLLEVCKTQDVEPSADELNAICAGKLKDIRLVPAGGKLFLVHQHTPEIIAALRKLHEGIDANWRRLDIKAKQAGFAFDTWDPQWRMLRKTLLVMGHELQELHGHICVRAGKDAVSFDPPRGLQVAPGE